MSPPSQPRQGNLFAGTAPGAGTAPAPEAGGGLEASGGPEAPAEGPPGPEWAGVAPTPQGLPLARRQLQVWQERLATYQGALWSDGEAGQGGETEVEAGTGEAEQSSLFVAGAVGELVAPAPDPIAEARALRPLSLPAQSLAFWRWPQAPHQGPALYFVLDRPDHLAHPLLLYVGETARADRRWKGAHDCKSYLAAYREALARADLAARLSIRFWCEAPATTGPRRALEQALIQRWKPPFNKETRSRWSTPFTAEVE